MSAWLVFAMLGFYPAEPFSGAYLTGSPMLERAEIQMGKGRILRLQGRGLQAALNGSVIVDRRVVHAALAEGGVLSFR